MSQKTSEETKTFHGDDAWIACLDNDIKLYESGTADNEFPKLYKALLTADDPDVALEDCVRRFRELDGKSTLTYEPLGTLLDLARLISYDDFKQDILLRLVTLLTKQPDAEERAYEERLSEFLHKNWNGKYPVLLGSPKPISRQCAEWVNLSVFKARTLNAGICAKGDDDDDDDDFKAPFIDIPIGLELQDRPPYKDKDPFVQQILRDCKLMVSAQYILIAGEAIKSNIEAAPRKEWDRERWRTWAAKFLEAATWENITEESRRAAEKAHDTMIKIWPE